MYVVVGDMESVSFLMPSPEENLIAQKSHESNSISYPSDKFSEDKDAGGGYR